jgi:hypothetical protein
MSALELESFMGDLERHPIDRMFRGKHFHDPQFTPSVTQAQFDDIVVVLA